MLLICRSLLGLIHTYVLEIPKYSTYFSVVSSRTKHKMNNSALQPQKTMVVGCQFVLPHFRSVGCRKAFAIQ